VRAAFLGPEGTFSEEALLASSEEGSIEPVPMPTIYDCVMAVQEGRTEAALVPIENSLEGSVNATLDALAFEADRVTIVGEVVHPIRHSVIAREQLGLDEIERVVSHPQASAQCARFLRERVPQAEVVSAESTADAVRVVAHTDHRWAALGPRLAAELYGCEVLLEGVEDHPENETRFVWLGRTAAEGDTAAEGLASRAKPHDRLGDRGQSFKTSTVFWGLPDAPGALVEVLKEFAAREVNLSKIESRPRKEGLGRYIFFADLEGAATDESIAAALAAVEGRVDTLRVLGSYPAARDPS
jgi:prephenate dehydratase